MTGPDPHRALRESLGGYVLGHLDPEETARVRAHLAGCAECRAELAEIAPAADALVHARHPLTDPAEPPPGLADRIEDRIRREERRVGRRRTAGTTLVAALTGAAAMAALVFSLGIASDPDPAPVVPLEAVAVEEAGGIEATAELVPHTWGVEVRLTASGLEPGRRYRAWVLGADGVRSPAGAFVGVDGEILCNLSSAVLREAARGFVVRDETGRQVLRSDFPA